MPLLDTLATIHEYTRDRRNDYHANNSKLILRLADVFSRTWDLGFTAFGGPPVHFGILHRRFVDGHGGKTPWIDEQTYQELFALCQSLPGPASTKMLFCMTMIHAGLLPAVMVFLLWSLPGAIGMYGLSLGVQKISSVLPGMVYALLSGLNSATVGLVALAAIQLAEKAIKDRLSRILVMLGACAGMCYNALWYFPVLIVIGGVVTALWDVHLRQRVVRLRKRIQQRRRPAQRIPEVSDSQDASIGSDHLSSPPQAAFVNLQRRTGSAVAPLGAPRRSESPARSEGPTTNGLFRADESQSTSTDMRSHGIPVWAGLVIIAAFFGMSAITLLRWNPSANDAASFVIIIVTRAVLNSPPLQFNLFANMYLAGTIIFGGGPVVIPLLREYVVQPGWVSSRDFLIGLAIIQSFPGPNFNFSVYLGALAMLKTRDPGILGAMISYIGIFLPGLTLAVGAQGIWRVLRTRPLFLSLLRGINATAVGLVFTAVYRLWQIGYLTPEENQGQSLGNEPWWVVVAVVTYCECAWFNVPAPLAIAFGGVLGIAWYGVVSR